MICHTSDQFASVTAGSVFQLDRRRLICQFFRKFHHGYIDADTYNCIFDIHTFRTHLCKNATDLLAADYNIIRPFDLCLQARCICKSTRRCECRQDRKSGYILDRHIRTEQKCHGYAGSLRGAPCPSSSSSSCILFICNKQRSVCSIYLSCKLCPYICGIRLIIIIQFSSDHRCRECCLYLLFRNDIRLSDQTIAFIIYCIYNVTFCL